MNKKKLLVLGNYNAGNIGDDLLMSSIKSNIRKYLPNYQVDFVSPGKPNDYFIFPTGIRSFLRMNWIRTIYAFYKSDVLVLGGGGLLNPEERKSLLVWGVQIIAAKFFNLQVICLANSFPFSNSKFYRYLLKKIDFFTVRDSYSYNFLNKLELKVPIKLTADLAFIADLTSYVDSQLEFDTDKFLVLNLRTYKHIDSRLQEEIYLELVEYITKNTNYSLYLLPFAKDDSLFLRHLNNLTKDNGRVFLLPFEKDVLFTALSRSVLTISQRLHPNIVSLCYGKPTIALSYSSKVVSLLNDFTDIRIFDLTSTIKVDDIISAIDFQLKTSASSYDSAQAIKDNKKRAEMNFSLLKSYLE